MKDTVLLTLQKDFEDAFSDTMHIHHLVVAFGGERDKEPYVLSTAGILFHGKSNQTEVVFKDRELFVRFSQVPRGAQQGFAERCYEVLTQKKVELILINVAWAVSGPWRNITASFSDEGGVRKLVFALQY